jgi:hypothetical protein
MRYLAVVVVAATLGSVAAAATSQPTIRITKSRPQMVVTGTHFKLGEKVTVIRFGVPQVVRHVVAVNGTFTVDLGASHVSRCFGLRVSAIGSLGSRAFIRTPLPACLPVPLPARGGGSTG